jgi:hypothetical protein
MASFVWMLLTEPSYKPNTLTALSLAGEESRPEKTPQPYTPEVPGCKKRGPTRAKWRID